MVKIVINAINKDGDVVYYAGYGDVLTGKGLGSGALTGTNRVPMFTSDIRKSKSIETYIDAKRITGEIIDAMRYRDIERFKVVGIHLEG